MPDGYYQCEYEGDGTDIQGTALSSSRGKNLVKVQEKVSEAFRAKKLTDVDLVDQFVDKTWKKATKYMYVHADFVLQKLLDDPLHDTDDDVLTAESEDDTVESGDEEWTPKTPPRTRSATKAAEAAAKASGGGSAASSSGKKKKKKKAQEKKAKKVSQDKYIAVPGGVNVDEKGNVTPVKKLQCMGAKRDGDRCSRMPSMAKGQWLERLEGNYWVCSQHNNSKTVVSPECKIESGGAAAAKAIEQEIDSDDDEELTKAIPVLSRSVKEIVKQIREDFKLVDQLKAKVQTTREALDNFDETETDVAQLDALLTKLERLDLK